MPKKRSQQETLAAWRLAEEKYQAAIAPLVGNGSARLTKNAALSVAKARSKADGRRDTYFRVCLD